MSKKNPEMLDAGITAFFFFREREKDLGKAPLVGFFDFFKVRKTKKLIIIIDFICITSLSDKLLTVIK